MMLLNTDIDVKVGPNNIAYWKSKGYSVDNMNVGGKGNKNGPFTLTISSLDLPKGSNVKVDVKCDQCSLVFQRKRAGNMNFCSTCTRQNKEAAKTPSYNGKLASLSKDEKGSLEDHIRAHGKLSAAKKWNTTLSVIVTYCNRNGIIVPKYKGITSKNDSNIDSNALKSDIEKGLFLSELCDKHRVSRSVIHRICKANNIPFPEKKSSDWERQQKKIREDFEKIVQDNQDGKTLLDISKERDLSIEQLKAEFRRTNIPVKLHSYNKSKGELEIKDWIINELGIDCHSIKKKCDDTLFELDIYIPSKEFAIEYCGEYWHSHLFKAPDYHLNKWAWCKKLGIKLMTIFESEWRSSPDIIKSMIKGRLGLCKRIYARSCVFEEISSEIAKKFHEKNHIHGYVPSSKNFGLYSEGELVSVISFSKSRYDKTHEYEITRFSSLLNHVVVGGFSKLLKNSNIKSAVTYANLRFGEGEVYQKNGFKFISKTPPNYYYFDKRYGTKLESRIKYQKHKLKKLFSEVYSEDKSELTIMEDAKYLRIYDCGNYKYSFD